MHKKIRTLRVERLKKRVLCGLYWKSLLLYLDNIIANVPGIFTHLMQLNVVFLRLRDTGLKLKPAKACAPAQVL